MRVSTSCRSSSIAGAWPSCTAPESDDAADDRGRPQRLDLGRYRRILGSSRVWLLAPTWIALNAVLGSWTTQSVFQLVRDPPPGSATSC